MTNLRQSHQSFPSSIDEIFDSFDQIPISIWSPDEITNLCAELRSEAGFETLSSQNQNDWRY